MRKILVMLTLLIFSNAAVAGYWGWEATASSQNGWGVGQSPNKSTARQIALRYCAQNTPTWDTCYINSVNWVWIN